MENTRPFHLCHQVLCITGINFEEKIIVGYTELTILPLQSTLRKLKLNCRQCTIYRVLVNDTWETDFSYNDPTLQICPQDTKTKRRDLSTYLKHAEACYSSVDADNGGGELLIHLPSDCSQLVKDSNPIRVAIEFAVQNPQSGICFVVPKGEGSLRERGAHVFSCHSEGNTRSWFPCVDTMSAPCTWKLELTVDAEMVAVSCGDLLETVRVGNEPVKTYHYLMSIPTAAPNIAFAVGPFEVYVDPHMHEVTHFCLPQVRPLMQYTIKFLHEAFEFYEELLSTRFPYSCYKQVFVDEAYDSILPYASMTILSTNLLHSSKILDQTWTSRRLMASAVARQFFGCFITPANPSSSWLTVGLSAHLAGLFIKRSFGNNEHRYHVQQDMKQVCQFERQCGGILLESGVTPQPSHLHYSARHVLMNSSKYQEVKAKKAALVIRIVAERIGFELMLQVCNKIISLAKIAADQKFASNTWTNLLLSSLSFLKTISVVSGKNVDALLQVWANQPGFAHFVASYSYNKKHNSIELSIKQDMTVPGTLKYVGPLQITIQEFDGSFSHTIQIEENKTKFEIACQTKGKRTKKKKVPLSNGEEMDLDSDMSALVDNNILWMRIDPDMRVLCRLDLQQQDLQWQLQLKHERDIVAQLQAIEVLESYPSGKTRQTLVELIESDSYFYRVRIEAAMCLSKVANALSNWNGPPAMLVLFRKLFGAASCNDIVRLNRFDSLQRYFLQKAVPVAMAHLRNHARICPKEVTTFLLDLIRFNDNRANQYSDNYYIASLIDALSIALSPSVAMLSTEKEEPVPANLSETAREVLEIIVRYLNLEKRIPSYKYIITRSCLKALRQLQKYRHIPNFGHIFKPYAEYGVFEDVRLTAFEILVDILQVEQDATMLDWLLEIAVTDPCFYIRHRLLQMLIDYPPYSKQAETSALNNESTIEKLWKLMNETSSIDTRLRVDFVDFYHTLYARSRPGCMPIPECGLVLNLREKKAHLNPSVSMASMAFGDEQTGHDADISEDDFRPKGEHKQLHSSMNAGSGDPHRSSLKREITEERSFTIVTSGVEPSSGDRGNPPAPKLRIKIGSEIMTKYEEEKKDAKMETTLVDVKRETMFLSMAHTLQPGMLSDDDSSDDDDDDDMGDSTSRHIGGDGSGGGGAGSGGGGGGFTSPEFIEVD